MMYNVSSDNLLSNYIANIIVYVLCNNTTHILCDQVTITQTVSPFSSTTYKYNFEIKCYIMTVAASEIIHIYQSYGTLMKLLLLTYRLLINKCDAPKNANTDKVDKTSNSLPIN